MANSYFITPEKCRALIVKARGEQFYESLLADVIAAQKNLEQIESVFAERLPDWRKPAKPGIGRHPDAYIAFIILDLLEFSRREIVKIMSWKVDDVASQRQLVFYFSELPSAKNYEIGHKRQGSYLGPSARLSAEQCKILCCSILSESEYLALREQIKALRGDTKALQNVFTQRLPHFLTRGKPGLGYHPHGNLAFLVMEALGFEHREIRDVFSQYRNITPWRESFMRATRLQSEADFNAGIIKPSLRVRISEARKAKAAALRCKP